MVSWREEEEGWSSTQLELREKIIFRQCVLEKKTNSLCIVGSLTQRVKGLREERASSQRSHRVAQLKAVSCLGMRTRYECCEMW